MFQYYFQIFLGIYKIFVDHSIGINILYVYIFKKTIVSRLNVIYILQ